MRFFGKNVIEEYLQSASVADSIKRTNSLDEVYAGWIERDGNPAELSLYFLGKRITPHKYLFNTIPPHLYNYNVPFYQITINDGVESIGEEAFYDMFTLQILSLPASIKEIGRAIVNPAETGGLEINYAGTFDQWSEIKIDSRAFNNVEDPVQINCKDKSFEI